MKSVIYNQDTKEVVAIIDIENSEIVCMGDFYLEMYDDDAEPCFVEYENDDNLYLTKDNFVMYPNYLKTQGNDEFEMEEEEDYED